jgi:hypothetical protein
MLLVDTLSVPAVVLGEDDEPEPPLDPPEADPEPEEDPVEEELPLGDALPLPETEYEEPPVVGSEDGVADGDSRCGLADADAFAWRPGACELLAAADACPLSGA